MKIETTLRKALFLRMGTWLFPADRPTNRKRRELRKWIVEQCAEQIEEAGVVLLPGGGFRIERGEEFASLGVTIDFSVDNLNLLEMGFQPGVYWPNMLTDEQDNEVDELEEDVKAWIKADKAKRELRSLPKKEREKLLKESLENEAEE